MKTGLMIMIGGKGMDKKAYEPSKPMLGGKGTKPEAYKADDEGSDEEDGSDPEQMKREAYAELAKAIKTGNDKDGMAALDAYIEACRY